MKKYSLQLLLLAIVVFTPFSFVKAETLSNKLSGKILLQVESHGEAWYVNPANSNRYYLANGTAAYNIMRNLGVGITNNNLLKFQNNINLAKRQSGKIFLQVEDKGQAYYVNSDGALYYLKNGEAAYEIMKRLGLGITNANLTKISEATTSLIVDINKNEQKVLDTAREVISSLSVRDYKKLEGLVSSDGLSLDLYPNFSSTTNLIAKNAISLIPSDTKIYLWGYTDGKGDPINLTRAEFLTKYIYTDSIDYLKAPEVAVNKILGSGNSINTIIKDVNGRTFVAFHFSGFNPEYAGIDWTTLYLVFDSVNGEYKLRGIAKDNWTI